MGVFGVDVSNHQASFDFRGWDFAFIKASEGNSFRDWRFSTHLANARAAGCLVAAYHYQRNVSAQSQVDLIKEMVPQDVPVIIDVEDGSGPISITREIIRLLREAGYDSPFLYLPRWFWQKPVSQGGLGSANLAGLPMLWASWYPDYVARPKEQGIAMVPSSAWNDYGGLRVAMMQFTSTPFDQNYYPGTRDDLARLLNGGTGGGGTDDMTVEELVGALNTEGHPLGEALRKQLTQYKMPKAPDDVIRVIDPATGETNATSIHDETRWLSPNIGAVLTRLEAVEKAVSEIKLGGVDPKAVAEAILETIDVDLVRRPQGS